MRSTALVARAPGSALEWLEVSLPDPRDEEIVVEIDGVGICHTDVAVREGSLYKTPFPLVPGHEGAGRVVWAGAKVSRVAVGDQVILSIASCGCCAHCVAGLPSYCDHMLALNYGSGVEPDETWGSLADGTPLFTRFFGQSSFARQVIVHERLAVAVDAGAELRHLGALGCSALAGAGAVLNVAKPSAGESVVVFGMGAVGISAAAAALSLGCSPVIAVDRRPKRLQAALELGVHEVVDANGDNTVRTIRRLTRGGAQVAVDSTGVPTVLNDAVRVLARLGICVLVGAPPPDAVAAIPPSHLLGGRSIRGTAAGDSNPHVMIPRLIDMWRDGSLPVERLTTDFPVEHAEPAINEMVAGNIVKPVLIMP